MRSELLTPHDQALHAYECARKCIKRALECRALAWSISQDYSVKRKRPPAALIAKVDAVFAKAAKAADECAKATGPFALRLTSLQNAEPVQVGLVKAASAHEAAEAAARWPEESGVSSKGLREYYDRFADGDDLDTSKRPQGGPDDLDGRLQEIMATLDVEGAELDARLKIEAGKLQRLLEEKRYGLVKLNAMEEYIVQALREHGALTAPQLAPKAGYENDSDFRKTLAAMVRHGILKRVNEGYALPAV